MTTKDEILDAKGGAALLKISRAGFWLAIRKGRLPQPYYPLPRAPRWCASELLAALEQTRDRPVERMARAARARSATLGEIEQQTT